MKRTQIGWVFIVIILIMYCFILYSYPTPSSTIAISIISILLLLLFNSLTINVDDTYVSFSFGIGLIKGKYRLEDIESCKPIIYLPIGWGIRYRPGTILYNVSGNKAIELVIKGKKRKVWIGTDVPDEFSEFINSKLKNK